MITPTLRTLPRRAFLAVALLLGTAASATAQAVVAGRVTDQANGNALVGARVIVVGTSLTATTSADGRYRIAGVPGGQMQIRASQIGYASITRGLPVAATGTTTVDFQLVLTPYSLDEVVVTATGDQAKREVGNVVSTVETADLVRTTPVANMNDLLVAKAPGVQVLPGNLTGAGARVRIRGNSSLTLSNNPIYVVDGIRVTSDVNSSSIGIGGTNPGRVNDLNPADIESIDIVRGPSASTLYGTDAANGVIVIKTKKGRAGKPVWNAYVEQGAITDKNNYPSNYRAWRTGSSTASNSTVCRLADVVLHACTVDSVTAFNPWRDPESSPLSTGHRQQYGLQVSGGTDLIRYYVSGDWEDEIGVLTMPSIFEQRLLAARNIGQVPYEQLHPNGLRKTNVRANLSANLSDKMDVQVNTGFVTSTQRLPQTDNNTTGLGSNLYGGPGFKHNIITPATGVTARDNYGYRLYTPDDFFSETVNQYINRTISSGTFNYRPTHWLAARVVGGLDFISREDTDLCMRDQCTYFGFSATDPSVGSKAGYKQDNRSTFWDYTLDANSTASYRLGENVGGKSVVGMQIVKEKFARNGAFASYLPPGATTVTAGAIPSADETTSITATVGYFAEQTFSYKDRLYFTGAFRTDRNSAFGKSFQRVYYPKASLSYVVSDEGWFPKGNLVTSFRLRGAYGASGRQPGPNDAIPFLVPVVSNVDGVDTPGLVVSALGNSTLKPERTSEVELGFDAAMLRNKVNLEFTYYKKVSRDALIGRTIAPSAGTAATRLENIGKTMNEGIEVTINSNIVDTRNFGWEVTLAGSYNKGKIVSLGGNPPNRGTTNSDIEGYPIQGWWLRPYTYADKNGDGIIQYSTNPALNEITVGDTAVYVGPPLPPAEFTAYNTIDLFGRKLRVQALVDAKAGGYQLNGNERIRCQSRTNCRGDMDPTASLQEQAAAVAVRQTPSATQYGYVSKTDFVRFRELSFTYNFPDKWARFFAASRLSATVAGRNLAILTKYPGIDPESGYFGTNIGVVSDFQTAPPARYYTFRLNVAF
jgi:TonB-linked SusC/RagA family outer membrane protein